MRPKANSFSYFCLLLLVTSICSFAEDDGPAFPDGLIVNRLSLDLRDRAVAVNVFAVQSGHIPALAELPSPYKIAFETGHLMIIRDAEAQWKVSRACINNKFQLTRSAQANKLESQFKSLRYDTYQTPADIFRIFCIPKGFNASGFNIEFTYEDEFEDMLLKYNEDWTTNKLEIIGLVTQAGQLEAASQAKQAALDKLKSDENNLNISISNADGEIARLTSAIGLLARKKPSPLLERFKYSLADDYFKGDLTGNMQPIPSDVPYDPSQVKNPVLQPEVNSALKEFYGSLTPADLKTLGVNSKTELGIVSAARTPLEQCALRQENPVAIGIFSTGHAFGVAVDIAMTGKPYDIKSYYDPKLGRTTPAELKSLLSKNGKGATEHQKQRLEAYKADKNGYTKTFDAKLAAWNHLVGLFSKAGFVVAGTHDANHFNLKDFVSDKNGYGNKIRLKMLSAYNATMQSERTRQNNDRRGANERIKKATDLCIRLDAAIDATGKSIEQLQKTLAQKNDQIETKRAELAQKERERAEAERRRNRENNREPRERNDRYYERQEFTYRDQNTECHGYRERSSRDGAWERGAAECHSRETSGGGGAFRGLD